MSYSAVPSDAPPAYGQYVDKSYPEKGQGQEHPTNTWPAPSDQHQFGYALPPNSNPYGYVQGTNVPMQQVVIMQQPGVVQVTPVRNFCGQIVLSCFVFWCCGWICGLIAFILAMVASDSERSGQQNKATRLGHASYGLSIAGIVTGIICLSIIIALNVTNASSHNDKNTGYSG